MSQLFTALALGMVWLLAWPAGAPGAEFTAQMLLKDGGKTMPGKLSVKDGMMRQEFLDVDGQTITIVRQDKKVVWVLMPSQKAYVEMPLKSRLPGQFLQLPPDALNKRPLGQETVNGYVAEKYEVTVRVGNNGLEKQTFWVVPKLGMPVKMVCTERNFLLEYRSIKEGQVAERLFTVPPGYRRLTALPGVQPEN